jgi:uncharacterized membrane protein YjgN (DUF898 family)
MPPMTRFIPPAAARWSARIHAIAAGIFAPVIHAYAQTFEGSGLNGGVQHGKDIKGIATSSDIRGTIVKVLAALLDFLALIAVIVVIIAGFMLIFSFGNEEGKEKAKKTIFYTLIGLAVILFARVIVGFITTYLAPQVIPQVIS